MSVVRFGVSLEQEVLDQLDNYVKDNKFTNRSQAIRHIIKRVSLETKWKCENEVAGTINLVYDHQQHDISQQINELQHKYHKLILSSQHFHLDRKMCMEVIALRGKAREITSLNDAFHTIKGIAHSQMTLSRAE